jgi:hypothetical protein
MRERLASPVVVSESPAAFLQDVAAKVAIDAKTLRCVGVGVFWGEGWRGGRGLPPARAAV